MAFLIGTLVSLSFLLFPQFLIASAALTNVTVDDTWGDSLTGQQVDYAPPNTWTPGPSCTDCTAHPDPSRMFNATWHDSSFFPDLDNPQNLTFNATITFTGVAVYVFCAIDHSSDPDGTSDMTFFMDGEQVGTFTLAATGQDSFSYNIPVYVNETVPSGQHSLTVMNGRIGGPQALMLLDYFVYTQGNVDPSPPTSSTPFPLPPATSSGSSTALASSTSSSGVTSVPAIRTTHGLSTSAKIGVGVGVALGVILISALIIAFTILRRRRRAPPPSLIDAFVVPSKPAELDRGSNKSGWAEGTWVGTAAERPHPSLIVPKLRSDFSGTRSTSSSSDQRPPTNVTALATAAAPLFMTQVQGVTSAASPVLPPASSPSASRKAVNLPAGIASSARGAASSVSADAPTEQSFLSFAPHSPDSPGFLTDPPTRPDSVTGRVDSPPPSYVERPH